MALSNDIVWEMRPSVGSDNNGGGFVSGASGTDFSQQNSAQQAYTDLVAATTTTITSVARPFSSVDVGNILNITAGTGWTAGRYKITSVTTGTATVDRAIATAASIGGTGNLGGALASLTIFMGGGGLGLDIKVYFKATGTLTLTVRQDVVADIWLIGYTTTRTDRGRATITSSSGLDPFFLTFNASSMVFENLSMSDTSGTRHTLTTPLADLSYCVFNNCLFDGFSSAINPNGKTIYHFLLRQSEIKNSSGTGITFFTVRGGVIDDCYIHANTTNGIDWTGGGNLFINRTVIKSNAIGVNNTTDAAGPGAGGLTFLNCVVINNSGDGIHDKGTGTNFAQFLDIQNSIIDSNGGYGVNCASIAAAAIGAFHYGASNAYWNNTSGDRNNYPTYATDIVLTGDPFTSRATDDFSLNNTAGAGAACKAVGFPSSFPPP